MKIVAVEYTPVKMKLREAYSISYETTCQTENIFIRLETSNGIIGFGCAAPDLKVTGETTSSVLKFCSEHADPILKGESPLRIGRIMELLNPFYYSDPSAMAMVDMALYDILGKIACLPLYHLLGGYRDCIKTSITIGIMPVDETVEKACSCVKKGFSILKIKGGKEVEVDIERVLRVRESVGQGVEIRFDANQGFSRDEAIHFVKATSKARLELMEQPTPKSEVEMLGQVASNVSIPVMADESLVNLKDAFHIVKNDLADMINIKLMKAGGIFESMRIVALAAAANYEVMMGCMDESALAIAAGLHFALARPSVKYADLDGHLDLIGDPAEGAVILKEGVLYPTYRPGLGLDPNL